MQWHLSHIRQCKFSKEYLFLTGNSAKYWEFKKYGDGGISFSTEIIGLNKLKYIPTEVEFRKWISSWIEEMSFEWLRAAGCIGGVRAREDVYLHYISGINWERGKSGGLSILKGRSTNDLLNSHFKSGKHLLLCRQPLTNK